MASKGKLESGYVKKETMYIGIGITLVVGVLIGIVFSSTQTPNYPAQSQSRGQSAPPAQSQNPGLSPQQASQIMALEQQVAANAQDTQAWTQLGHIYFDANRPDQAIRAYTKSLELQPNDANVLTDLGVMYRRAKQPAMAIQSFDKASAIDPRHEQARFNKGIVLMYDLGDVNGAIAAWEELLKNNPGATAANGTPISQLVEEARQQASK